MRFHQTIQLGQKSPTWVHLCIYETPSTEMLKSQFVQLRFPVGGRESFAETVSPMQTRRRLPEGIHMPQWQALPSMVRE